MSRTDTLAPAHPAGVREPGPSLEPVSLTAEEQQGLLAVARAAIAVAVGVTPTGDVALVIDRHELTGRSAATFVTLTERGELRGCMGWMDATTPVAESVAIAASMAARQDPRFEPVGSAELPWITLEVSVLGPLTALAWPERFRAGTDGIVVERGERHGLLLPEVATHHGLDRVGMLAAACEKAGLPRDAWRQPGTSLRVFRTVRFGGPASEA